MAMDDFQLLRAYVTERSEDAFRALVQRHIGLVRGVAVRQAGIDSHLADDITQRVFVILAQKAAKLTEHIALAGWLYTAARLESLKAARQEARRRNRETYANDMTADHNSADDVVWDELQPVLDDAMSRLGAAEREAVLLRYFSGRSFAEVGGALRISEEAARKRVDRAVEKLRTLLGRHGLVSSSSALCTALGTHAAPAVADNLVLKVVAGACQAGAAGAVAPLAMFMSSTKVAAAIAGVVLLLAATSVVRDASLHAAAEARRDDAAATYAHSQSEQAAARREAAQSQRERSVADVRGGAAVVAPPTPSRAYLQDPIYRDLARTASLALRHLGFQRFYRQLGLTPEQTRRFEEIMARQDQANLDGQIARDLGRDEQEIYRQSGPEWSKAMRELLGDSGKKHLEDYLRALPLRYFVDATAARSYASAEPITLAQADQLIAIVLQHTPIYQQGKGTDPAKVSWNEVWGPAAQILTSEQLAAFENSVEVWSLQKRVSLARKAASPGP
jgi:RNA polymerase sigma factor (sigma-70 family)